MKRLLTLLLGLALAPIFSAAQSAPISGQVLSVNGQFVPFASVRICASTATGTPCSPVATIYQDAGLTTPIANPTTADQYGNYTVYVGSLPINEFYVVQLTPASGVTWSYVVNAPYLPLGGGTMGGALTDTYGFIGPLTGTVTGSASLNVLKAGDTMTGTLTATGFIGPLTGNVTGSASLNVLKTGDTMTGSLTATGFIGPLTGNVTGHSTLDLPLTGGALTGAVTSTSTLNGIWAVNCAGVEDTAQFNSVGAAAGGVASAANVQTVNVSGNCVVGGQVTSPSYVHWAGTGGTITVPTQNGACHYTFLATNADNVAWDNLNFVVTTSPGGDNACYNVIQWIDTNADATAHKGVYIRNNVIHNSVWGAYVQYAHGTGSLSDVNISGNTVDSPTAYQNGDGVHVDGAVSNITIANNRFVNRGDACIGMTSESTTYTLSGFAISNNVCLQDRVGIDISGVTNGTVNGNYVAATTSSALSSPAFRIIYYPGSAPSGVAPANISVRGNYFQAAPNPDANAKLDINGSYSTGTPPDCNCTFEGNTFTPNGGAPSLYIRGNRVTAAGNTFLDTSILTIDYNGTNSIPTQNVVIGRNQWLGSGTINMGASFSLNTNVQVYRQDVAGTLSFPNQAYSVIPNGQAQTVTFAGCSFANNTAGATCTVNPSYPQQFADTSYLNTCSMSTTLAATANAVPAIMANITNSSVIQMAIEEQTAVGNATGFALSASYGVTWTCIGFHP